jgi:ferric-dicitrate binding protein FerR (iron transport regulator)
MEEKLKILRRYFSNNYSRNDYFELKRLILSEDSEIETLLQTHWKEFQMQEIGDIKDLSEVLTNLNQRIDEKSNGSFVKKFFIAYSRIAAVLVIPLFLALGFLYFQFNQYLFQKTVFVDVVSPARSRTSLNLPDGSMVWLNGDSHIRYPAVFGKNREVKIEGEAFFKVKSDEKHPFLVTAKDIVVRATGTQFNVMAYDDIPQVSVILKEGKVAIEDKNRTLIKEVDPGYELRYAKKSSSISYKEINAENYSSWINGRLIFSYAPLSEVVERMGNWYGIDIEIVDKELLQLHFKATFVNENIEEALKLLQSTATFRYEFSKRETQKDGSLVKSKIYLTKK